MSKIIFILYKRSDQTHDECMEQWSGPTHTSILSRLPGLTKWVQNRVTGAPAEPMCDGIGELWFESDDAMHQALQSPVMGEAVEDAKRFLDMERAGLVIVEEKTVLG
jgi:uncharacterized protein (TIGR02118 family)